MSMKRATSVALILAIIYPRMSFLGRALCMHLKAKKKKRKKSRGEGIVIERGASILHGDHALEILLFLCYLSDTFAESRAKSVVIPL